MSIALRNKVITASIENPALVARVKQRMNEVFIQLRGITGKMIFPEDIEPLVFFKESRTAGYVWRQKYGVRVFLNWPLLKANEQDFMVDTIPHEIAHLFQDILAPAERTHGPIWQKLMRRMGLNPERTHSCDTTEARRDKQLFTYVCACKKHYVSKIIHNKIQRYRQIRRCKLCHKSIAYLGAPATVATLETF